MRLVEAMRQLAGGVCVATAGRAPERTGYTGMAVFSLSVDPQLIVISIDQASSSFLPISKFGDFGLNVLSADQRSVAERFAGRGGVKGEARFQGADWRVTPRGVSLLSDALATLECRVEEILERHSHAIIVAEPTWIETDTTADDLIYQRAQYAATRAPLHLAAE
jgi:flavin reductase (DIM6/NTAB) family NADH-FMN oxidoreductase RutF